MSEEKVRNQGLPLDLLSDSSVPYRAEDGALVLGDARHLLEIPDASVDLVITDPPFNVGISYGVAISDNLSEKQYETFTMQWLTEALRVLKPRGQLYAIMPNTWLRPGGLSCHQIHRSWCGSNPLSATYIKGHLACWMAGSLSYRWSRVTSPGRSTA